MKLLHSTKSRSRLVVGALVVLAAAPVAAPANAQVVCPPGYAYSGYSCVPAAPAYNAIYPAPAVVVAPPIYDVFGFGGRHDHGHPHGHPHGHDDHHR